MLIIGRPGEAEDGECVENIRYSAGLPLPYVRVDVVTAGGDVGVALRPRDGHDLAAGMLCVGEQCVAAVDLPHLGCSVEAAADDARTVVRPGDRLHVAFVIFVDELCVAPERVPYPG